MDGLMQLGQRRLRPGQGDVGLRHGNEKYREGVGRKK